MRKPSRLIAAAASGLALIAGAVTITTVLSQAGPSTLPNKIFIPGIAADSAPGTGTTPSPTATATGTTTATITATTTATVTGTVVVVPVIAVDDQFDVTEDTDLTASGNVLANDDTAGSVTAVDGQPGDVGDPVQGDFGTLTIDPDGTLTYTLDNASAAVQEIGLGEQEEDTFQYTASNGTATDTATVVVAVHGTNDVPVAMPDTAEIDQDASPNTVGGNALSNDMDVDASDVLSVSEVDGLAANVGIGVISPFGTLTVQDDGSWVYALDTSAPAVLAIDPGESEVDSFDYTVSDGNGGTASTTITITILGLNNEPSFTLPVAPNQTVLEDAGAQTVVGFATGISAGPGEGTQVLTFNVNNNNNGLFSAQPDIDEATGTLTYTPAANAFGVATVTVVLTDNGGTENGGDDTSDPQQFTITVTPVNDAPVITTSAGSASFTEGGGPVAVDPGLTVIDPDSQIAAATAQITSNCSAAEDVLAFTNQLGITGSYNGATCTLTLSGTASVADYQTALRSITYENVSDSPSPVTRTVTFQVTDSDAAPSNLASRDVTVAAANDAPVITTTAGALAYTEGDPATVIDSGLTVTDADDANLEGATVRISAGFQSGDELLFTDQNGITGSYSSGTGVLTLTGTSSVANYQTALRSVEYRHSGDNPGTSKTIEFRADDGDGLGPAATRDINVTPVDDTPVAVDDSATLGEDAPATAIDVLANDTDPDGGPKTIQSASDPANGTVVVAGDGLSLTYQPDVDYCNDPPGVTPDTFTYTLNGGSTATVSVTVTCVDDPPVAVNDSGTAVQDAGPQLVDVLTNDTDIDGGPKTIQSAGDPANGTVVVAGDGLTLTYEPDPGYCNSPPGTTPDTFDYTLNGGSSATVSMEVFCDLPPDAIDDAATVAEDAVATAIDVLGNDTDGGDGGPIVIISATQPANGTVVLTGGLPGAHTGLTYEPNANYCNDPPGTTPDTFTYTVNGGDTAIVSVTVTCVDDPPVAVDDSATLTEDDPATLIDVLANDTDIDGGPTTIASASDPANGTVVIAGDNLSLTYQPDPDYCNAPPGTTPDTFTYTLNGGSTATVSVTVNCLPDPPTAVADSATVLEDSIATTIDVLANDTDPDSQGKSIASATDPANGAVVIAGDNLSLTYEPDADYCNTPPPFDTFDYTISPGGSSATVSVTVTCVNDEPSFVLNFPGDTSDEDAGLQTVAAFATGSAGPANESAQTLGFEIIGNTNAPLFSSAPAIAADGTLTYTAALDQHGTATITVQVVDNGGTANGGDDTSPSQQFTITVDPVNDPPVAATQNYNAQSNMAIAIPAGTGLLTGATDADSGDSGFTLVLTVGLINGGATTVPIAIAGVGTITALDTATGAFTFDPEPGVTGPVSFTYTVCDNGNPLPSECSAAAQVNFTIAGPSIWFVDTNAASNGTGTLASPFNTLASVPAVDDAGDRVFVYFDATPTGTDGLSLLTNEWLIGQGATGASFDALFGISPPAGTIARPSINGSAPTIGGTVALGETSRVQGVVISTAAANALTGTSVTGVSVTETTLATTTGTLINFSTVSGIVTIGSVTKSGPTGTGVSMATSNAVVTISGGSITSTVNGVTVNGGTGNFSYAGTVSSSLGTGISVSNRAGAATTTFSGAVTVTGGNGVTLTSNGAGGTIALPGGVSINTSGAGTGLAATGGGNVTLAGTNNITTATGIALNVVSTTITGTFTTINSNGASSGIILNAAGANAVTINGGTIANSTGIGVDVTSKTGLTINNLTVSGGGNHGISVTSSSGINFDGLTVSNNGNAVAENGIDINNLTGTNTISDSTVTGSGEDNINVTNDTGTLTLLTISGSAKSTASTCQILDNDTTSGNVGVNVQANATATMTVTVNQCHFEGNRTVSMRGDAGDTANLTVNVTNNIINGGNTATSNQGNQGIEMSVANSGDIVFDVTNNHVGHDGTNPDPLLNTGINVFNGTLITPATAGSVTGKVHNNLVHNAGATLSGFGIRVFNFGNGTGNVRITSNTVSNVGFDFGIFVDSAGATSAGGLVRIAVLNNTSNVLSTAIDSFRIQSRNLNQICASISGNASTTAGTDGGFVGMTVRLANDALFSLEGLALGPQTTGVTDTFVTAQNPGISSGIDAIDGSTSDFTGVAAGSCGIIGP
ncbi:MAG: Ig-like domain-containing protein [Dehalococcoidia bacterium]